MILELPQGQFFLDAEPSTPVILVAGGRPPDANWLNQVVQNCPVWAIDSGIDVCRSASVIPEILIGDADSSAADSWQWGEDLRIPVLRHPADKDLTDLQLALQELGRRRPGALALLTGGMGGRFDHAYSNLFSLLESVAWGVQPIGTADEVIKRLKVYEDLGYDEYSFWIDTGMSFERKKASLERFIADVMPAFR